MKKLVLTFAVVGFFSFNTAMACGGGAKASTETTTEVPAQTASNEETAKKSCAGKAMTTEAKIVECTSRSSSTSVAKAESTDE